MFLIKLYYRILGREIGKDGKLKGLNDTFLMPDILVCFLDVLSKLVLGLCGFLTNDSVNDV